MQVQIRTDNHIEGTDAMSKWVSTSLKDALSRFAGQITRVEVHFSDESAGKKSDDPNKLCMLEAHLEGANPLVVKHHAANLNQALEGASEKLTHLIEKTLGRKSKE